LKVFLLPVFENKEKMVLVMEKQTGKERERQGSRTGRDKEIQRCLAPYYLLQLKGFKLSIFENNGVDGPDACIIKNFTGEINFVMYQASVLVIVNNLLYTLTNIIAFYVMELITAIKSKEETNRERERQ
jgi:hypothetical protein